MDIGTHTKPYIMHPRTRANATLQLICFPYAGGGTTSYSAWLDALPRQIEVCPVKLPGREDRLFDPPHTDLEELLVALASDLESTVGQSFAFFGHSMGAMIAYELTRYLRRQDMPLPVMLLVSGHRAPHLPDRRMHISHLPNDQFITQLSHMNGTPAAVVQHRELMEMLLPALRADFTLCETYTYFSEAPLECPIAAFSGTEDYIANPEQMAPWCEQTSGTFRLHCFAGGHFFLHELQSQVIQMVVSELTPLVH